MQWIKDNLTIISLTLLILGTLKMVLFYRLFNIDIVSYLEVSEILQLQYSFYLVLFWVILTGVAIIGFITRKAFKQYKEASETLATSEALLKEADEAFSQYVGDNYEKHAEAIKEYRTTHTKAKSSFVRVTKDIYTILGGGFVLIVTFLCFADAQIDYRSIKRGESRYEVSFTVDNKQLTTNGNYLYLGRTKNYIFFYDRKNQQSEIFDNSDVKNLKFREGKP